ncbi:DUF1684 domain-containing protein [Flaviaesturariibacter flavus]|uniref:DUF1684 domain-containing protein n=1 Tax=Flaviaesturariibacter flavus TaxID=2502780 RepID=A0A4R1BBZ7_9BACT|nr:DUF1684 domain-containing protein [Flaviaesturariibacter flavus]TCJ14523.1 DUF1684 domain-containing protein [Flaviaesturariibacter flavus]
MMKFLSGTLTLLLCLFTATAFSQKGNSAYVQSINDYVRNYITTHEVVKGADRKHLHFFAPDSAYRVVATFEPIDDKAGFKMPTSQQTFQPYFRYGKIRFTINGVPCELTVYQSKSLMKNEQYKSYLFIPFTDRTTGDETYDGGRYIDVSIPDITNNRIEIDFNKAYNPYCCYSEGYSCPIPPKENALAVAIRAGEMKYTKPVH